MEKILAYHGSERRLENGFKSGVRTNFSIEKSVAMQFGGDEGYLHLCELFLTKIYFVEDYLDVKGLEGSHNDKYIQSLIDMGYDSVASVDMSNILVFDSSCAKIIETQF